MIVLSEELKQKKNEFVRKIEIHETSDATKQKFMVPEKLNRSNHSLNHYHKLTYSFPET